MFYREKKVDCGTYREVDIIPRTADAERAVRGKRGKRKKVTEPREFGIHRGCTLCTVLDPPPVGQP